MVDGKQVERALASLVGLPLRERARAADMEMFSFGDTHLRVAQFGPRKGQTVEVTDFALHIQCAWRIRGPSGIVVASAGASFALVLTSS